MHSSDPGLDTTVTHVAASAATAGLLSDAEVDRLEALSEEFDPLITQVRAENGGKEQEVREHVRQQVETRLKEENHPWADVWAHAVAYDHIQHDAKYRVMLDWFNNWVTRIDKARQFDDRFTNVEKIDAGSFGVVFRAKDGKRPGEDGTGSPVALKLPYFGGKVSDRKDARRPAQHIANFFLEARRHVGIRVRGCVTLLDNDMPNIVTAANNPDANIDVDAILDWLRTKPIWFSMQLIEGRNLKSVIDATTYDPPDLETTKRAVSLMTDVAEILEELHGYKLPGTQTKDYLVHKDLKPANILLDQQGNTWLTDFGLATPRAGQLVFGNPSSGTPSYMAPEQCQSDTDVANAADTRTDIWAWGAIFSELLTGRPPFVADTRLPRDQQLRQLCDRILNEDPDPPTRLNSNIPPHIPPIILKCLKRDRSERYGSFDEVLDAMKSPTIPSDMAHHIRIGLDRVEIKVDRVQETVSTDREWERQAVERLIKNGTDLLQQGAQTQKLLGERLLPAGDLAAAKATESSDARKRIKLAQELMRDGKRSEAVKQMEEALSLARAAGDDEDEVEILVGLALLSSERRGRGNRRYYLQEAERKVGMLTSNAVKAIYFRARAVALDEERDLAGAEEAYKAALDFCAGPDDKKDNLAVQGCIARSSFVHLLCNQRRLEDAQPFLDECEKYARENKNVEDGELFQAALEAGIHFSLVSGNEDGAVSRVAELEEFAVTSRLANRIGGGLINVANHASHQKAHRAALLAAEAAIRLGRRYDDVLAGFLVGALYTEALVTAQAGNHEKALTKAEAILDLCNRPEDATIKQAVQQLIAEIRRCAGDAQSAVDLATRALSEATGGPESIAFTKSALATALNDNGQTEEAFSQAKEAWTLLRPIGLPAAVAIRFLSQITNYGSQLGDDVSAVVAEIEHLPDESNEVRERKKHAVARTVANSRLRERLTEIARLPEPHAASSTSACSSLPEANALVVRPLLGLWEELPDEEATGGLYDFWGRGNLARILQNTQRFPNSFNVTTEVRSLDDVKRVIRLWGLYADFLVLLWKGEMKSGLAFLPIPDDYEEPGGWGYMVCAGSVIKMEGSERIWHPALGPHSVIPDEVASFLATEARPFLQSGRLVIVPAVAAGCINPGHGPFEQLLAEAANALPSVRWKGFAGSLIGMIPHSPDAPLEVLAELAEVEASRLRKLRLLLLKRSRELTPDGEISREARTLSLEIDDALRDFADRNERFARKKGLARAKEPLAAATARFRLSGKKLTGEGSNSPFAPLFVLQSLGYGWRVESPDIPQLPPRFEPRSGDVIGTWLAPPSAGWSIPTVQVCT